jgi:hypothetical protein
VHAVERPGFSRRLVDSNARNIAPKHERLDEARVLQGGCYRLAAGRTPKRIESVPQLNQHCAQNDLAKVVKPKLSRHERPVDA